MTITCESATSSLKIFYVHSVVVFRSPVLASALRSGFKPSISNFHIFEEEAVADVECLLKHLYGFASFPLPKPGSTNPARIYSFAEKFGLPSLKAEAVDFLMQELDQASARLQGLKSVIVDFHPEYTSDATNKRLLEILRASDIRRPITLSDMDMFEAFAGLVVEAYEGTIDSDRGMRDLLLDFARSQYDVFFPAQAQDTMRNLLGECPKFAYEVISGRSG